MGRNASPGQGRRLGEGSAHSGKPSPGRVLSPEPDSLFAGRDVHVHEHKLNIAPWLPTNEIWAKTRGIEVEGGRAVFDLKALEAGVANRKCFAQQRARASRL